MLLAGDIGGTKSVLAVFSPQAGPHAPLFQRTYSSTDYPALEPMVREFLAEVRLPVERACFGVAGPVLSGATEITNLSWPLEERSLRETLALSSVKLLNDMEAMGYAVPFLKAGDLYALNPVSPIPGGAIAVVAPGTGLGEGYLTWDGQRYRAHPSEGGHSDFAPADAQQAGLWQYLHERFGHVSNERVCSGMGLPNIYAYLRDSGFAPEPAWLRVRIDAAPDQTPVIVQAALQADPPCPLCQECLRIFVATLGAEAGSYAVRLLATGGVYLGGGMPPRIVPLLSEGRFLRAFTDKGRMAALLRRIPVHVILRVHVPLLGAACYGLGL